MSQRRKPSGLGNAPFERVPSVELPTPMVQKEAATSLWQKCQNVKQRLQRVPGFADAFLNEALNDADFAMANSVAPNDPVSHVCACLRRGSSLCFLFNCLGVGQPLNVNPDANRSNIKACQKGAAHFIMACKRDLRWGDDDLFTITQLYDQDTNGTVKVIHTITKLLDELERKGLLMEPEETAEDEADNKPKDKRAQVVRELLVTEREYVRDLEKLQDFQRQLAQYNYLTQDTIHNIFMNLNLLVDFQRRFLIGVEYQASQPPPEQRFGSLFLQMEDLFSVYEPFCANFTAAQELAIAENANLSKLSSVIEPNYGLPALLIKPVQRICKYPLLLKDLHKSTDESYPYRDELEQGLEAVKRVTDKVNETKRQKENELAVQELIRRVDDWKGHTVSTFGNLLLEDTFMVLKSMTEREYHVYLFERIVLCCKEAGLPPNKKSSKSNSILKKPPARKKTVLQLKGRIFVNNVLSAEAVVKNGLYCLQVTWRGDLAEEDFTLKCRTEEILRQWQKTIRKAMDDVRNRRGHLSNGPRLTSPMSQFPTTSASEFTPGIGNSFEDEDGETVCEYESTTGRSTPSTRRADGIRSLPPDPRDPYSVRPRAKTEDSSFAAASMVQSWRNQTPSNYPSMPSLPRVATSPDVGSHHSLRSSASSRNLKNIGSMEWSNGRGDADSVNSRQTISRQTSQASLIQHASISSASQLSSRNRSASSPNMYQAENTDVPSVPPLNHHHYSMASQKRESSSSGETDPTSSRDSGGSGNQTAASSAPSTGPHRSVSGFAGNRGNAIKVKVNFGEDTYVIVVLSNVTFHQLVDKVLKKISICGDRTRLDPSNLRLRYQDDDGDKITLMSDDDVAMAFDMSRSPSNGNVLALFVD